MEPWDGPASLIFSDGRYIGGMLDRNGLRPSRYVITKDDLMVMGSEVGVQSFPAAEIREKGRLKPGKIILVDVKKGKIYRDEELKSELASKHPYMSWINKNMVNLEEIQAGNVVPPGLGNHFNEYLTSFNYSREDIETIIKPMAESAKEPIGSMGNDVPTTVLSKKPYRLFAYFKQLFAQVTNPPIDPLREGLVMSLMQYVGRKKNLLVESAEHCKQLRLQHPFLSNDDIDRLRTSNLEDFNVVTIESLFDAKSEDPEKTLKLAIDKLVQNAIDAIKHKDASIIIISDKNINESMAPIPALLAVSAVNNGLLKANLRGMAGLILESGEPREVNHFCLLCGFGVDAVFDGEEGLYMGSTNVYDLIVLDIMLPELNGFDILR
jgi:CheY-like chemotaxis protein